MKTCRICARQLPLDAFYPKAGARDGLTSDCRTCRGVRSRRWRAEHPERQAELGRRWVERNRPRMRQLGRQWYQRHADQVRPLKLLRARRWHQEHREAYNGLWRRWYHRTRRRRDEG